MIIVSTFVLFLFNMTILFVCQHSLTTRKIIPDGQKSLTTMFDYNVRPRGLNEFGSTVIFFLYSSALLGVMMHEISCRYTYLHLYIPISVYPT